MIKQDEKIMNAGAKIVADALAAPLIAQINNARVSVADTVRQLGEGDDRAVFDAAKRGAVSPNEAQLFDAARVVIRVLQIAFVHARNVLQTGAWEISETSETA